LFPPPPAPVLLLALRGSSGYAAALRSRVGPGDEPALRGGSIHARRTDPTSIAAEVRGEGEENPGLHVSLTRGEAYGLLSGWFRPEEVLGVVGGGGGKAEGGEGTKKAAKAPEAMRSLFPHNPEPTLVILKIYEPSLTKIPSVLRRFERAEFGLVAITFSKGGGGGGGGGGGAVICYVALRRVNGAVRASSIVGPSDVDSARRLSPNSLNAAYCGSSSGGRGGGGGKLLVEVAEDEEEALREMFGRGGGGGGGGDWNDVREEMRGGSVARVSKDDDGGGEVLSRSVRRSRQNTSLNHHHHTPQITRLPQGGKIDGFQGAKFVRNGTSLHESGCLVVIPRLLDEVGVSRIVESVQKQFKIINLRLVRWTKKGAEVFLRGNRGRGGEGGGSQSSNNKLKSEKDVMELLECDEDRVSLVLAIESDNALIRIQNLISDGCDSAASMRGNPAGQRATTSSYGRNSSRANEKNTFLLEGGGSGAFASRSARNAGEELLCVFGELWGVDKIESDDKD